MNAPDLLNFVGNAPSPYHAVDQISQWLGYGHRLEGVSWKGLPYQSFTVQRNGSSVVAFGCPTQRPHPERLKFHIVGAHTDSPGLKLKPCGPKEVVGGYRQWPVEIYGGVLLNSWLDRDCALAGRLSWTEAGQTVVRQVRLEEWVCRVPQLAIHLDRKIREEGLKLNAQEHMTPVVSLMGDDLLGQLRRDADVPDEAMDLQWDLFLFDLQAPAKGGRHGEFIFSARLDNLAMCHAGVSALSTAIPAEDTVNILCCFNHEEVGSVSTEGAGSSFLSNLLERFSLSLGCSREEYLAALRRSFLISADMAHAVHPNYEDRHDADHMPQMGLGPVLKNNANMRYSGTSPSHTRFMSWAREAGVPVQNFVSRNDLGCGSTIGPTLAAQLGIDAVDVGSPMLSMHSIREMAALEDHEAMIRVMKVFFSR